MQHPEGTRHFGAGQAMVAPECQCNQGPPTVGERRLRRKGVRQGLLSERQAGRRSPLPEPQGNRRPLHAVASVIWGGLPRLWQGHGRHPATLLAPRLGPGAPTAARPYQAGRSLPASPALAPQAGTDVRRSAPALWWRHAIPVSAKIDRFIGRGMPACKNPETTGSNNNQDDSSAGQ